MDSRIKIGQKYFQWSLHEFHWLKAIELKVANIVDPSEVLYVACYGKVDFFTINVIEKCVELAIAEGWYSQKLSFFLTKKA